MADYQYLLHLTRGRLYSETPGVFAATPWGFTLHLSKGQITVMRQCCEKLQASPPVPSAKPIADFDMDCAACGTRLYPLQDNKHMLVWRDMSVELIELWLEEAGRVDPLSAILLKEDLAAELRSWLYRRTVHVPKFTAFFARS